MSSARWSLRSSAPAPGGRARTRALLLVASLVALTAALPAAVRANPSAASLGGNGTFMCLVDSVGHGWCWGPNPAGNLGDRTITTATSPVQVLRATSIPFVPDELTDAIDIAAGGTHACAATTEGYAWCWGSNSSRQLGDGTTTQRLGAVVVEKASVALAGVLDVEVGGTHSCALREGGQAWCWGNGREGRLGIGTTPATSGPVRMRRVGGALGGVLEVVAGGAHTCARIASGTVWCTGDNRHGQLGDGTRTMRKLAVEVEKTGGTALTDVVDITASAFRTCAATASGAAWCWGTSEYVGTPDQGTSVTDRTRATRVKKANGQPLTGITRIATGWEDSCALGSSGQVWCWGHNLRGAAGNGTTTPQRRAVQVTYEGGAPFTGAIDIAVGRYFACAITSDNEAWCWGSSKFGTIGDGGSTTNPSHPTPVDQSW